MQPPIWAESDPNRSLCRGRVASAKATTFFVLRIVQLPRRRGRAAELERYTKRPRSCMSPLGKPWLLKACVGLLSEYAANNAFLLRERHSAGQNPRLAGA